MRRRILIGFICSILLLLSSVGHFQAGAARAIRTKPRTEEEAYQAINKWYKQLHDKATQLEKIVQDDRYVTVKKRWKEYREHVKECDFYRSGIEDYKIGYKEIFGTDPLVDIEMLSYAEPTLEKRLTKIEEGLEIIAESERLARREKERACSTNDPAVARSAARDATAQAQAAVRTYKTMRGLWPDTKKTKEYFEERKHRLGEFVSSAQGYLREAERARGIMEDKFKGLGGLDQATRYFSSKNKRTSSLLDEINDLYWNKICPVANRYWKSSARVDAMWLMADRLRKRCRVIFSSHIEDMLSPIYIVPSYKEISDDAKLEVYRSYAKVSDGLNKVLSLTQEIQTKGHLGYETAGRTRQIALEAQECAKTRVPKKAIKNITGKWYAPSNPKYIATIIVSGNGCSYTGTDGNFKHTGTLGYDGTVFKGEVKDVPGFCCGNEGYMWLKVVDGNTLEVKSEWWKPERKDRIILEAGWDTLKRVNR